MLWVSARPLPLEGSRRIFEQLCRKKDWLSEWFSSFTRKLLANWTWQILKISLFQQARIHTGFHCFIEIGQIFHYTYIFNWIKNFSKLKSVKWFWQTVNILSEWLKSRLGKEIQNNFWRTPQEACFWGRPFRKSVSIQFMLVLRLLSIKWQLSKPCVER